RGVQTSCLLMAPCISSAKRLTTKLTNCSVAATMANRSPCHEAESERSPYPLPQCELRVGRRVAVLAGSRPPHFSYAMELNMRVRDWAGGGTSLAVLVLGLGCSGAKPTKIEGIVTLAGKPVEGAMVSFVPKGGKGLPATGLTESAGAFHLTTFSSEDGALPGDYKILVTKSPTSGSAGKQMDPEQIKSMMLGGAKKAPPKENGESPAPKDDPGKQPPDQAKQPPSRPSLLPEIYANFATTN